MITYVLLIAGFIFLLKGADLLVDGASALAKRMQVSDLVIGLTVVAFGTSAPELFINVHASLMGNSEIAIGNILGSNIANIFLILGAAAIIYPITVQRSTALNEIPFSLLAAMVLGFMANDYLINGEGISSLTRSDGLVLLSFFTIFMYSIFSMAKGTQIALEENQKPLSVPKSIFFIVLGLAGLVLGGQWIVDGAVKIAEQFSISESFIGLTVVAIGTSLPELATSIVAARKKNMDIAVGNVIGSNIFNIFLILGVSSIIRPLPFHPESVFDIVMTMMASILFFLFVFIGQKHTLQRWQGVLFLLIYVGYLVYLVIRG